MNGIQAFLILVLIGLFVYVLLYLLGFVKIPTQKSPVPDDVLKYVQTLLENTPHKQGLSSELVAQRRDIIEKNLTLITASNLEQKTLLDEGKTDKVVTFGANRFLPYTHQEIIQLFTGLLIPEEYRNPMYPNPAPVTGAPVTGQVVRAVAEGGDVDGLTGANGMNGKSFKIDFDKIPSTQSRYDIFYGISPRLFDNPQDQGTCGSCWAFASCAVAGAQVSKSIITENVVTPSVQYYINCVSQNFGCDGGFPIYVYEKIAQDKFIVVDDPKNLPYIQQKAPNCVIPSEEVFKYPVSLTGIISFGKDNVGFFPVDNLKGAEKFRSLELNVPSPQLVDKIKKILFFYGPMTVLIYVDEKLPYISSGIYRATDQKEGKKMNPNHAVVIAGYGVDLDAEEYWIIRNSWGRDWAESGYFQLSVDSPICGITVPLFGSIKNLPLIEEP
jgi:hypothetical protein